MNTILQHLQHKIGASRGYWINILTSSPYIQLCKDMAGSQPNPVILSIEIKSQNIIITRGHENHSSLDKIRKFSLADPDSIQSTLDYIHDNIA